MPNQNDPTQNPGSANQVTPPATPVIFPQSDLPPLPPEFQNLPTNNAKATPPVDQPVSQPASDNTGSAAPPDVSSVVSKPKKKFGGGKIIATILGLVVLVGATGAGIVITQQKQIFQPKADSIVCQCDYGNNCCSPEGKTECQGSVHLTCKSLGPGCSNGYWVTDSGNCATAPPVTTGKCGSNSYEGCVGRDPGYAYCSLGVHRVCRNASTNPDGTYYCDDANNGSVSCGPCEPDFHTGQVPPGCTTPGPTNTPAPTPTITPTPSPSPTPTASPTATPTASPTAPPIAPSCIAVKAYNNSWVALTNFQLSALKVGDTVNFCVSGNAPSGTFDKAQFMINTALEQETTTKRPGSNDFCQSYTILSTDTTVSVRAKIHHSSGVWAGEDI